MTAQAYDGGSQRARARHQGAPRPGGRHPDRRRHHRRDRAAGPRRPRRCRGRRRHRPADPSRPHQCPHPRPRQSRQGHGRPLDARAAADRRALDQRQPHGRGQVPEHLHRRARDADEGLHRLLRPDRRVPAADARGPRGLRQGLCGCRHARGGGADGRQPQLLRGDPGPARCPAAVAAEGGGAAPPGALRGDPYRHAPGARRTGGFDREQVRPAVAPTIPHHCTDEFMLRLRTAGARVRRRPAQPCPGVQGAGHRRPQDVRQDADRASAGPRAARPRLRRRARRLARR